MQVNNMNKEIYSDDFTLPSGARFSWAERKELGIENITYKNMCILDDKIMKISHTPTLSCQCDDCVNSKVDQIIEEKQ